MTKGETLEVVNQMLDESYKSAKEKALKLLSSREWDFDQFGDRNTFARCVFDSIIENEQTQYKPLNKSTDRKYNKQVRELESTIFYELCGI